MRFWQRCTASSLAIPTSGLVPARSCLACRLAVDLEVCRAVVCRFAGRRVHHSPQAAAPAATPSAQRVGSASCMSRYRPIRASCFAAGAGHPAPGLPAERRQPPHPGKSITCLEKKRLLRRSNSPFLSSNLPEIARQKKGSLTFSIVFFSSPGT